MHIAPSPSFRQPLPNDEQAGSKAKFQVPVKTMACLVFIRGSNRHAPCLSRYLQIAYQFAAYDGPHVNGTLWVRCCPGFCSPAEGVAQLWGVVWACHQPITNFSYG